MRVDIDKLEALEKEHPLWSHQIDHDECSMYPCLVQQLLSEVRELRGIAEAARLLWKHAEDYCDCPGPPPYACELRMKDALARYDAGGA